MTSRHARGESKPKRPINPAATSSFIRMQGKTTPKGKHVGIAYLKPRRHPLAFTLAFSMGLAFHTAALGLTILLIRSGDGRELNPLYYLFGQSYFAVFGYASLVAVYLFLWFARMPMGWRWTCVSLLLLLTTYDFSHDFIVMTFHHGSLGPLIHFLQQRLMIS